MCGFPKSESIQLSLLLALAQGAGVLSSTPLFDRFGRRALVLPSTAGSGACLGLVALAFALGVKAHKALALVGLIAYLVVFGLGLSSGPWVINAEIYPLRVRGLGQSVTRARRRRRRGTA